MFKSIFISLFMLYSNLFSCDYCYKKLSFVRQEVESKKDNEDLSIEELSFYNGYITAIDYFNYILEFAPCTEN